MTSRFHGFKISGPQQFFLTETAICTVERWKKSMGYRFVPECNAQEIHTRQFFRPFFLSYFIEIHGNFDTMVT